MVIRTLTNCGNFQTFSWIYLRLIRYVNTVSVFISYLQILVSTYVHGWAVAKFFIYNIKSPKLLHCTLQRVLYFFCERGVGVGVGYGVSKVIFRQKTKCLKKLLNTTLVHIFLVLLNRILSTIQYWCQGYQHCSL